jgi:hypothetical protein
VQASCTPLQQHGCVLLKGQQRAHRTSKVDVTVSGVTRNPDARFRTEIMNMSQNVNRQPGTPPTFFSEM